MTDMRERTSGLSLRLQRIARDVKAVDLAAAMGVTPGWVSRIESRRLVPDDSVQKYLTALATFPTIAADTPDAA